MNIAHIAKAAVINGIVLRLEIRTEGEDWGARQEMTDGCYRPLIVAGAARLAQGIGCPRVEVTVDGANIANGYAKDFA